MYREKRFIHRIFHIDTNRINSRSKLPAMNKLEEWFKNGVIHIEFSEVAQKEALIGNDHLRKDKAYDYVSTKTLASTIKENEQLFTIRKILFPREKINSNKRNDIEIVFNALKYGAILITDDGSSKRRNGILDHREELKESLGLIVMSDGQAVEYVQRLINERDNRARIQCERFGIPLPNWVGQD